MAKGTREFAEKGVKDVRDRNHRTVSAEEKIRFVREGLRGEESITALLSASLEGRPAREPTRCA